MSFRVLIFLLQRSRVAIRWQHSAQKAPETINSALFPRRDGSRWREQVAWALGVCKWKSNWLSPESLLGSFRTGAAFMQYLSPFSSVFSSCLGAKLSIPICFGYSRITLFKPCVLAKQCTSVGLSTVRSAIKLFSVCKTRAESPFTSDLIPAP